MSAHRGSVRRVNPATGAMLWQPGLPNSILGSPSMNSGGVIATATYDSSGTPNADYLINASTGALVRTLSTGGMNLAQSAFAQGWLYTANVGLGLSAYHLP